MEVQIDSILRDKIPNFKAGIIFYNNIVVGDSPQMVKGRLQLFQESIFFDLQDKELSDLSGITEWRQTFKATGTNPSRYRPSVEALYRRISKQNYIQPIHSAIDLNNFFSLQYEVPIGIYTLDQIEGDVTLKIGAETDQYDGLNGRRNSMKDMITSADKNGPFGSPFVDSERTKVTETTTSALQIIYLKPSTSLDEADKLTQSLMKMFLQVHGGEGVYTIVK
ncbi:B3/B4 domain-containing protein [Peribacillus sp. JNUCC 23]|uniref:B3/B4 domain-containing protein n=1 Tax=Peribacillus sp. NPDC096379 TaxID=3364393 RepID=UPI00381633C3